MRPPPNVAGPMGEPPVVDFLRILQRELTHSLAPELTSERSKVLLNMAQSLLDYLVLREGGLEAVLASREASARRALAELGNTGNDANVFQALEVQLEQSIAEAARDPSRRAKTYDVLRRFMREERAYFDALVKPGDTASQPPSSTDTNALAERLTAYLQSSHGVGKAVKVSSIGSPLGGYSKEVFVVNLEGPDRPADRVVIRRDRPHGPLETSVTSEYAVLLAASAADVPVAKPVLLERDASVLGSPFLILPFVEGEPVGDFMRNVRGEDPTVVFRQLAEVLGRIHSIEPASAGIAPSELARPLNDHVLGLLDRFEEQWRRRRATPAPVLAAAFAWMRANLPADEGKPVVVHADPTPRNLLFRDGKVAAILDWETWHLGDPAEDLAYCKDEIAGQMDWSEFLRIYRAAGGVEVAPARVEYWMMWKYLFGSISSISMMEGIGSDLRTAFGAVYFTQYCLGRVADRLAQIRGSSDEP